MCKGPERDLDAGSWCMRNKKKPERVGRPRDGHSGTRGRESRNIMFNQSLNSKKSGIS